MPVKYFSLFFFSVSVDGSKIFGVFLSLKN